MRILHVVSSYWPAFEFGGPIQSVHLLNKFLAKKGVDITVYTTNAGLEKSKDIPLKKEVILDEVKVFYFPYCGYRHYNFSLSLFWHLGRQLKNFDLIHITGVWNFPISAAAFWARFYKKPYIISPRGSLMALPLEMKNSPLKKVHLFLFGKRDLKNAAAIHFTTEAEKEEYLKIGLPLKKSSIIPNGLDLEEFKEDVPSGTFRKKWNIDSQKKVVLFLGRLNWKKGLDTLIPAFSRVIKSEPNAFLVLEGEADKGYKETIEKMIGEQNISDKVLFTGFFPGKDIAALKESDVFVLPSYSENFGMAVIQAMYIGLPVVITKEVGIAPSVSRAKAGIVVNKDEKQVSEAILKILNNPVLAKEMGGHGRRLVETEFSPTSVAEKFIKLYNELQIS